jgi:type VI secretion system protein VasD
VIREDQVNVRLRAAWIASVALVVLALVACGRKAPAPIVIEPPKPAPAAFTIAASPDTNPDNTGRPSPVVVRIYQLKGDAAFNGADFFPLFDDDRKVLGPELISREEYVVAPSEKRTIEVAVSDDARFVGAVAAFRDIRNSQWRVLMPAARTGMTVAVERTRVRLTVAD